MSELVRWETDQGSIVVEMDQDDPGFEMVSRVDDVIGQSRTRLEDALKSVRGMAESALTALKDVSVTPDTVELEFGVKLNAAAGAVIARTSVEGHMKVKLTWGGAAVAGGASDGD
ncbi:CU044_2847 family protein [Actinomadura viridis]|uniref:Trypsin-co-occurring domain-containing protein n=1 Tax=Actinomadura viridis TaxID=58110 RepID=A0A931GNM5_9ACTN|nr:CU044_2847 family protein [Actinomadura viridis]MBG6093932.1 hypothetical protein [Actinomadura viridis]